MIIYKRKKKQLIIPCGLGPVVCPDIDHTLQQKIVDSSTVLQQVEPDSGYYGLYRVIINPLTDPNLLPGNIKEGVEILGVMGTYAGELINLQYKRLNWADIFTTMASAVYIYPDEGYDGLSAVRLTLPKTSRCFVLPSTSAQTLYPSLGKDFFTAVDVAAVTAEIDPDILAENIKKDVEILGVVGTFEGGPLQSKSVNSSTGSQNVTPDPSYYGLSQVTVSPYTVESKSQTITQNGTYSFAPASADALSDVSISVEVAGTPATVQAKFVSYNANGEYIVTPDQGYDGLSSVDISVNVPTPAPVLQSKTVDSSTSSQSVTYDNGYDGLSAVTVNPYTLDSKTVDPSTSQITVNSSVDGLSSVTVNPYTVEADSSVLTQNGTYTFTPQNADALSSVTVDVSVNNTNWIIETKKGLVTDLVTDTEGLCNINHGLECLFMGVRNLETVEFTNSSCIADSFANVCTNCIYLTSASFPNLTTTDEDSFSGAFENCISLSNLDFPELTYIAPFCFDRIMCYAANGTYVSDASITFPKLVDVANYGMRTAFMNAELQSVNFPLLTRAGCAAFSGRAFGKGNPDAPSGVHAVSFPNLVTCEYDHIQGQSEPGTFSSAFSFNDEITSISFPSLVYGRDDYTFEHAFEQCTNLASISVPEFTSRISPSSICDCSSLTSITAHPLAIGITWLSNDSYQPTWGSVHGNTNPSLTTVTLTYDVTDNISFSGCSALSAATVLHILEHLDLNISGKTCTFYVGLTVTDDAQGSIQAAYNAAVNAGWTINNLTILPYS